MTNIFDEISMKVVETEEAFIFSIIDPFIQSIAQTEISKEELVKAVQLIRLQREASDRYGVTISNDWCTAVSQTEELSKAYGRGYDDAMKRILDRHKEILRELEEA